MTCLHKRSRTLVRNAIDSFALKEMYERYEREREEGVYASELAGTTWRTIVRWEVEREARSRNLDHS